MFGKAHNFMDTSLDIAGGLVAAALGIGAVGAGIFFSVNTSLGGNGSYGNVSSWDSTSRLVWPYIFVLSVVALLFMLLYRAREH
jgi:hypothetical protein